MHNSATQGLYNPYSNNMYIYILYADNFLKIYWTCEQLHDCFHLQNQQHFHFIL